MEKNQTYAQSILKQCFRRTATDLNYNDIVLWLVDTIKNLPQKRVLVVSLVGGAASGKSTLAQSLKERLADIKIRADIIATDDFNRGDRVWRKQNYDDKATLPNIDPKQIDPLKLKDFELLNRKINEIKAITGPSTVAVPTYNPLTGLAIDEGEENYSHRIGPVDVLLVEGDFHSVKEPDLIVFIHLPDELRLQNRIDRDTASRGGEATKTIESFDFRQQYQHTPLTLPVIEKANIVLDISIDGSEWYYNIYTRNT